VVTRFTRVTRHAGTVVGLIPLTALEPFPSRTSLAKVRLLGLGGSNESDCQSIRQEAPR
jgi:hypothetical protein